VRYVCVHGHFYQSRRAEAACGGNRISEDSRANQEYSRIIAALSSFKENSFPLELLEAIHGT
jgi:hypothetical protein